MKAAAMTQLSEAKTIIGEVPLGYIRRLSERLQAVVGRAQNGPPDGEGDGTINEATWRVLSRVTRALADAVTYTDLLSGWQDECKAEIWHGPGHQSRTQCERVGLHEIHLATYGSYDQVATWRGDKVFSGTMDEAPEAES